MTEVQQQHLFLSPHQLAELPQPTHYYVQQCHEWELEFRLAIESGDREHIDDAVRYVRMYADLSKMALLRDLQLELRTQLRQVQDALIDVASTLERGHLLGEL